MYCYRGKLIKDIVWANISTNLARQIQGESEGKQIILGGPGILLCMFCSSSDTIYFLAACLPPYMAL